MESTSKPAPAGHPKNAAAGILIFLLEELGDARLRAEHLSKYVKEALDLVEKSSHRDHFFEVAGHILQGAPDALFRLSKALDAAALAAAKLDYEETKQGLKPEKVDELEAVAEGIRLRYLNRRSHEGTPMSLTPKQAADLLTTIADETDATGAIPTAKLATLLAGLGGGKPKIASQTASGIFRQMADYLRVTPRPERGLLANDLRKIHAHALLAEEQVDAGAGQEFQKHNPGISDEEAKRIDEMHDKHKDELKKAEQQPEQQGDKQARFPAGKPADPTKHMSPEDAETWGQMNDKYKDVVKNQNKSAAERRQEAAEVGAALARRGIEATYAASHGHGFWVKDRGFVDMKTARTLAGAPAPAASSVPWGRG